MLGSLATIGRSVNFLPLVFFGQIGKKIMVSMSVYSRNIILNLGVEDVVKNVSSLSTNIVYLSI